MSEIDVGNSTKNWMKVGAQVRVYCIKYGNIPLPKASKDMIVEITGVPEWDSWSSRPMNHDDLDDLLDLAEMVPSERRLNLFRLISRH